MRLTRRVVINTVAFLVLSALLALVLAVQVLPTVFDRTYSVYGLFTAAGGVASNQEVTYRGVQVGRVGEMTLIEDAVRIEMIIKSAYPIPRDGTRARVLFKSAVGEQFIDLLPDHAGGPTFRNGDQIPLEMTSIPVQIEDLLRELDAVLQSIDPAALGSLIHELGTGLTGHGKDLQDLLLALDAVTAIGANRRGEIASTLTSGAAIQDSFNASREDFVKAIAALRSVLSTAAGRTGELQRTLGATRKLDTEILSLLAARRTELNQVLADLGTTVRLAHAQRDDLDLVLTYLGPFLADAVGAYEAPYFVFNLVFNQDNPACSYDPSSRPARPVVDDSPKSPETAFACTGVGSQVGASSSRISSLPTALQVQLDRLSWLKLFTLGY
jgi:phospholipid/cholesterol/gamma-HCH transport system substrate-binding protein